MITVVVGGGGDGDGGGNIRLPFERETIFVRSGRMPQIGWDLLNKPIQYTKPFNHLYRLSRSIQSHSAGESILSTENLMLF